MYVGKDEVAFAGQSHWQDWSPIWSNSTEQQWSHREPQGITHWSCSISLLRFGCNKAGPFGLARPLFLQQGAGGPAQWVVPPQFLRTCRVSGDPTAFLGTPLHCVRILSP